MDRVRFGRALLLIGCIAGCRSPRAMRDAAPPDLSIDLGATLPDLVASVDLTPPSDLSPFPCGSGVCMSAQICCSAACDDPNSPMSCGGCGNTCTDACATSVTASMATRPANWTFNGSATYDATAGTAVLTPSVNNQVGSLIYDHAITTDSFAVTFEFRITRTSGLVGGDGMAFMIEKDGNTALGFAGGGLGIAGLNGFGVELDLFNDQGCGDLDSDHLAVDQLTKCMAGSNGTVQPTPLAVSETLSALYQYDLGDGAWRTCTIHVVSGKASVTIDQNGSHNAPALSDVQLTGLVLGDAYYFGFAAATGGSVEKHEIRNITVTFPVPHCL
jgi:hypothetical protein